MCDSSTFTCKALAAFWWDFQFKHKTRNITIYLKNVSTSILVQLSINGNKETIKKTLVSVWWKCVKNPPLTYQVDSHYNISWCPEGMRSDRMAIHTRETETIWVWDELHREGWNNSFKFSVFHSNQSRLLSPLMFDIAFGTSRNRNQGSPRYPWYKISTAPIQILPSPSTLLSLPSSQALCTEHIPEFTANQRIHFFYDLLFLSLILNI